MNHQVNQNPVGDEGIIELYFARDERAIRETERCYGGVCMQVSMRVLDSRPDAEECVSDTYLKTWNTIPPTRPRSLCAYVCRIARNLSINRLREMTAQKRNRDLMVSLDELEACIPAPTEGDNELAGHISRFLWSERELDRRLFVGRYWFGQSVGELATDWKLTTGAVSMRLHKCRERLRRYLNERGYTV